MFSWGAGFSEALAMIGAAKAGSADSWDVGVKVHQRMLDVLGTLSMQSIQGARVSTRGHSSTLTGHRKYRRRCGACVQRVASCVNILVSAMRSHRTDS